MTAGILIHTEQASVIIKFMQNKHELIRAEFSGKEAHDLANKIHSQAVKADNNKESLLKQQIYNLTRHVQKLLKK